MSDTARQLLEHGGLPPTLNRMLVLAALLDAVAPMSAREVYEKSTAQQTINRVTVYRILDLLAEKSLVNKISTGERSYRYCARSTRPHGHFHCIRCSQVMCVENDAITNSESALMNLPFDIHSIDLRLDGVCPECRAKE